MPRGNGKQFLNNLWRVNKVYYGKLISDELAAIKLRRYWGNILSPKQSHSAMRRKTDPV